MSLDLMGETWRNEFLKHEKDWAAVLLPGFHLRVRFQWYDCKDGFKVLLWCNSCPKCQSKQGWRGYSKYVVASNTIERAYTPLSEHSDPNELKKWIPLTSTTENALKQHMTSHSSVTTQDLVKIIEKHQAGVRPTDKWIASWSKNHRENQEVRPYKWVESDWRELARKVGMTEDLDEACDALKIAAASYDPEYTVVAFCNPALLKETLDKLDNKTHIKLCGDGTFRLTNRQWVLLTVGVLSKHYDKSSGIRAFSTTFDPLMFALANKESEPTYSCLFKALCFCAEKWTGLDLAQACHQYHADMHPGEDLSAKNAFPCADKVADWAHLIGACTRPKLTASQREQADSHLLAHRSGIFATTKRHLSPAGKPLFALIEQSVHAMRSLPTAFLFHTVTHLLFESLSTEAAAVRNLKQYYFSCVPAETARQRWNVLDWVGDNSFLWSAEWWCGADRLQPGSASGTQKQESWHKHKLKNYMGIRTALPTLFDTFAKFTSSRLKELRAASPALPDVPRTPFPDRQLLFDASWLTKEGRTSAEQLYRTKSFDVHIEDDSTYIAMPQTLARYDTKDSCRVLPFFLG